MQSRIILLSAFLVAASLTAGASNHNEESSGEDHDGPITIQTRLSAVGCDEVLEFNAGSTSSSSRDSAEMDFPGNELSQPNSSSSGTPRSTESTPRDGNDNSSTSSSEASSPERDVPPVATHRTVLPPRKGRTEVFLPSVRPAPAANVVYLSPPDSAPPSSRASLRGRSRSPKSPRATTSNASPPAVTSRRKALRSTRKYRSPSHDSIRPVNSGGLLTSAPVIVEEQASLPRNSADAVRPSRSMSSLEQSPKLDRNVKTATPINKYGIAPLTTLLPQKDSVTFMRTKTGQTVNVPHPIEKKRSPGRTPVLSPKSGLTPIVSGVNTPAVQTSPITSPRAASDPMPISPREISPRTQLIGLVSKLQGVQQQLSE